MEKKTIVFYQGFSMLLAFGASFSMATYVVFLMSKGLNLFEVGMINFTYFLALTLFEIPTGAVADVFGRKTSVVLSCFIYSLGFLIYWKSNSVAGFICAEVIAALGSTFHTGAFQAWLVDRLNHHGFQGNIMDVFSRECQLNAVAKITGALLGAALGDKDLALPWLLGGLVVITCGIVAAVFMKEENFVPQKFSFRDGLSSMRETITTSYSYAKQHRAFRFLMVMAFVQTIAYQGPNMQWQPWFLPFFSSKKALGFIWAGISLAILLGAQVAPKLSARVGDYKRLLIGAQLIIGLSLIISSMGVVGISVSAFLFHELWRGMFKPLESAYLNMNITSSKERATLLSFESIAYHLGGVVGLPLSGFLATKLSIPWSWRLSGAILIVACVVFRNGQNKKGG